VHNVSQWPNLKHLIESLKGGEAIVSFREAQKAHAEVELLMLEKSALSDNTVIP